MKLFNSISFENFTEKAFNDEISKVSNEEVLENEIGLLVERIENKLNFTVPIIAQSGIKTKIITASTEKSQIEFAVPFSGNAQLFEVIPTRVIQQELEFKIEKKTLAFSIYARSMNSDMSENDQQEVINLSIDIVSNIEQNLSNLANDFSTFNKKLLQSVFHALHEKKAKAIILKQNQENMNVFGKNS